MLRISLLMALCLAQAGCMMAPRVEAKRAGLTLHGTPDRNEAAQYWSLDLDYTFGVDDAWWDIGLEMADGSVMPLRAFTADYLLEHGSIATADAEPSTTTTTVVVHPPRYEFSLDQNKVTTWRVIDLRLNPPRLWDARRKQVYEFPLDTDDVVALFGKPQSVRRYSTFEGWFWDW